MSKDVLQILFKPLSKKVMRRLVSGWGFGILENLDIDEIINVLDGRELLVAKFLELLLLYDMSMALKFDLWSVYSYSNSIGNIAVKDLENSLNGILKMKKNSDKSFLNVYEVSKNKEYYIVYSYEDKPVLIEEWGFKYNVVNRLARVRSILNLEKKTLLIDAESEKEGEKFKKALEKALKTKFHHTTFPPYVLQEFAEKDTVKKAAFACDSQLSGVEGIRKITLEGNNVFDAIKGLRARQDIDFRKVGPLVEAETPKLYISSEGKLMFKDQKNKDQILKKLRETTEGEGEP
ncbi:MAG: hypothetical protein KIH08_02945 [Candidatus Freyarchaeota archaeon]|nr:hypothetical protein [Candidatus Jordarchaeia archaeon]MBS7267948.1 hypothetical protein [Candidatus Jordarchaeia archaeon]MBS7279864.1 hypothetical protein [Candidatus Jordarchaeia archaeon]